MRALAHARIYKNALQMQGGRGGEKGLCGKEWAHFFASQTGKGKPLGQLGTMLLLGSVDPPRPPGRNFRTLTFKMSRHDVQYE